MRAFAWGFVTGTAIMFALVYIRPIAEHIRDFVVWAGSLKK